jgi:NCS2 family nucleobase:cation symporter-2/xanthine permease XanP
MFVGIITPPLVVSGALGFPLEVTSTMISASLLASGLGTLMQVHGVGPFGCRMLSVQGTSFIFVPLAIAAGHAGGMPLILGLTIVGGFLEIALSRLLEPLRRWFPPVVTGTVVILLGCSLIGVGMTDLAGGFGNPALGAPGNLALGGLVMTSILFFSVVRQGRFASVSIALGLTLGYLVALGLGQVATGPIAQSGWFEFPRLLAHGLDFDPVFLLPWAVAYLVSSLETMGDLSATSSLSHQPLEGPVFAERLRRGVAADGMGSIIGGLLGSMPMTTFAQNNGVIRLTGVAARRVGYGVGGMLVLLALIPKLGAVLGAMPKPVLGGATVLLFATVAVAGIEIVTKAGFGAREQKILSVSLALGLGVAMVPQATAGLAEATHPVLRSLGILAESGLALGALSAVLLNQLLPVEPPGAADQT